MLIGTGNAGECAVQVRRLIPHHEDVAPRESVKFHRTADANEDRFDSRQRNGPTVGGINHPPLRGKFFAMSNFFFALDCLRELSAHDRLALSWPTPSIEELTDALDGLCSRDWNSVSHGRMLICFWIIFKVLVVSIYSCSKSLHFTFFGSSRTLLKYSIIHMSSLGLRSFHIGVLNLYI